MNKLPRILISLSLGAAAVLSAQTSPAPEDGREGPRHGERNHRFHHRGPGGGFSVVRALDADKNRELSAAELANAPTALRTLDANSDGTVSKEELRPLPPAGFGERQRPSNTSEGPAVARERSANAPMRKERWHHRGDDAAAGRPVDAIMLALDANNDGALAESEIATASTSLAALDLNKDGKLTVDELRPLPPVE